MANANQLPETGFLRLSQIIGTEEVTKQQAEENRKSGKGPKRPREATPAIVPVCRTSWWAGCKSGKYPQPVKLGARTTCWRVEDIRALVAPK